MCVCICLCIYIHMSMYIHICMYMYIHTHIPNIYSLRDKGYFSSQDSQQGCLIYPDCSFQLLVKLECTNAGSSQLRQRQQGRPPLSGTCCTGEPVQESGQALLGGGRSKLRVGPTAASRVAPAMPEAPEGELRCFFCSAIRGQLKCSVGPVPFVSILVSPELLPGGQEKLGCMN